MTDEKTAIEYDVAFSFLAEDEPLAAKLNDLLSDRYRPFVFSKRQEQLAGTDGQETFGRVFGKTAQTVVVLYRDNWGSTPWTKTEETVIKNRALNDGWDFLLFVNLKSTATMPKWLPRTYIWQDFERYGEAGTVPVIAAHIQRAGGTPRTETLEQQAARIKRAIAFEKDRKQFLTCERGVNAARTAVQEVMAFIESKCAVLANSMSFTPKRSQAAFEIAVLGAGSAGMLRWHGKYSNTLDEAFLELSYWAGHPPIFGANFFPGDEPSRLAATRYDFDMAAPDEYFWKPQSSKLPQCLSNDKIAEEFIRGLLQQEQSASNRR